MRSFVKALLKELGNGGNSAFEKLRKEVDRHENEGDDGIDFPSHDAEAVLEGGPIQSHHLLSREVRQEE